MKTPSHRPLSGCLPMVLIFYVMAGSSPLFGDTIYDNSVNNLSRRFDPGMLEVGDEIVLAGSARNLTNFAFQFWGTNTANPGNVSFAGAVQTRIRFYVNDGPISNGYPAPGTMIYDSGWFPGISPTPGSTLVFSAGSDFPSTGLFLPASTLTWSVQFQGLGATDSAGVSLYDPPIVGLSSPDYWENNGSNWTLKTNALGVMNFAALLQATTGTSNPAFVAFPPTNLSLTVSQTAVFQVVAGGSTPLSYRWQFYGTNLTNGGRINGANTNRLTISNVQSSDAGNYRVVVTNAYGSVTSAVANLAVVTPPDSRNLAVGGRVTMLTGAAGPSPFTYQWSFNSVPISGATNNLLVLTNLQTADAGTYSVLVTSAAGSVNASAILTVSETNLLLASTNLVVIRVGDGSQTLTVNGNSAFLDQFTTGGEYVNTVAIPDSGPGGVVMSGSSFVEGYLTRSLDGRFLCLPVYGTNLGSGINVTTSTVIPRVVATIDAFSAYRASLVTTSDFRGLNWRSAVTDGTNNFWAVGSGGGTVYLGSSSARAFLQNTKPNDRVLEIFNGNLYMASASAAGDGVLGVYKFNGLPRTTVGLPQPVISTNLFTNPSGLADFAVSPSGAIIYVADERTINGVEGGIQRWDFNNGLNVWVNSYHLTNGLSGIGTSHLAVDWSGANPVVYAVTAGLSQNRLVKVADLGPASDVVTFAVSGPNQGFRGVKFGPLAGPPIILTQPRSPIATLGGSTLFRVEANGTEPLTYYWRKNGSFVGGPSSPTLLLTNLQAGDAATYSVFVSNSFGTVLSANVTLTIPPPTTIYANGFEFPVGGEWSLTNRSATSVGGRRFLGEFGNQTVRLALSNVPLHTVVRATFDLFIIRTWDGNGPSSGPDRWKIALNGASPMLDTTFGFQMIVPNVRQSYPDQYPADNLPLTGAAETNSLGYSFDGGQLSLIVDAVYPMRFTTWDAGGNVLLDFTGSGLEVLNNESWGLDNVTIETFNVATNELLSFDLVPLPPLYPGNPNATKARATAQFTGVTNVDVTSSVQWSSSDTNVFTVNSAGQVLGRGIGVALLTGSCLDRTTNTTVTVLSPIALRQTAPSGLVAGGSPANVPLVADFSVASNVNVAAFSGVVRTSSDPTIASINAIGLVTPLKAGSAILTASYAGLTNQVSVDVIGAPGFNASLIAYEGFGYANGSDLSGQAGGYGWTDAWTTPIVGDLVVSNGASGSLAYTDPLGNTLLTSGNGFFYSASDLVSGDSRTSRDLATARGADYTTTWISFLGQRLGPTTNLTGNPYPRGVTISLLSGATEKLGIGNSSGAPSNTWALIPAGALANNRPSTNSFSQLSLVVVRIDHNPGNDDAYLFINPPLDREPQPAQAVAQSLGSFDFSFNRVRPFVGANDAANGRPYAELLLDELRIGETYASVSPYVPSGANGAILAYSQDFEGAVGTEWSTNTVGTTPIGGRRFLGEFGNQTVQLTLTGFPAHNLMRMSYDLFLLRSWDGSSTTSGPDIFQLTRADATQYHRSTFNNHSALLAAYAASTVAAGQSYPGTFSNSATAQVSDSLTGAAEVNTLGYLFQGNLPVTVPMDSVYRLSRVVQHTASSVTFSFSGSGLQGLTDESWGLDNVRLELFNLPTGSLQSLAFLAAPPVLYPGDPVGTETALIATFTNNVVLEVSHVSDVSYASSDTNVFSVSTVGEVAPLNPGTAQLVASYQGLSATTTVSVVAPIAIRQTVASALNAGGLPVTATLRADFPGATNVNVTGFAGVFRASSNPTVAAIATDGTLTPRQPGTTMLTAIYSGLTNQVSLTVSLPPGFIPAQLEHRYSFGEPPNSTSVADSVGGANGEVVHLVPGAATNNFTGTGQLNLGGGAAGSASAPYVNLPNDLVSGRQSVTLEGWVTWNGPGTAIWQRIFDFGRNLAGNASGDFVEDQFNSTGASYLYLTPRGGASRARFGIKQSTGTETPTLDAPTTMAVSNQTHFAVVYDPPSGVARLYLNGQRVATGSALLRLDGVEDRNVWLGRSQFSADPFFNGLLNEFRIYDGALLDDNVQASFTAGPDNFAGSVARPVNDDFADAATLAGPIVTTVGANVGSTAESGENTNSKSIWWQWYATSDGPVTVNTVGSSFGSKLGIFIGSAVSNLFDVVGTYLDVPNGTNPPAQSGTFEGDSGTTYFISVDARDPFANATGRVVLNLTATWAPQVTADPPAQIVAAGYDAVFNATGVGVTAPFNFQWQREGTNLPGAIATTYSLASVQAGDAGNYRAVASGASGPAGISPDATLVVQPPYQLTTFAGLAGSVGSTNGTTAARFNQPHDLALDAAGNVYVVEHGNDLVRKITPSGVVSTLAGLAGSPGSANGTGSSARFSNPWGICVDASTGNLFVADAGNHLIRRVTTNGVVTTLAGFAGNPGTADGTGTSARFNTPRDVIADGAGNLYVADHVNHTVRKITPAGVVTTIAGRAGVAGTQNGAGAGALFFGPGSLVVDSTGSLLVAELDNHAIRKLTLIGTNWVVTTLAGRPGFAGSKDGLGDAARFRSPSGLGIDGANNLYVADFNNHLVRRITPGGMVTTLAGFAGAAGAAEGTGRFGRMNALRGITSDSAGSVYVADFNNHTIRKGVPSAGVALNQVPVSQVQSEDADVTLTVQAVGRAPFLYQWFFNGNALAGATNSTLRLHPLTLAQAGQYQVRVRTGDGLEEVFSDPISLTVLKQSWQFTGTPGLGIGITLGDVWARRTNEAYVLGWKRRSFKSDIPDTYLYRWNGTNWASLANFPGHYAGRVLGTGASELWLTLSRCASGPLEGCGADRGGKIYRSLDGGTNWTQQTLPAEVTPREFRTLSGITGNVQAVAEGGMIVRFNGLSWSVVFSDPAESVNAHTVLGATEGYYVTCWGWGDWDGNTWEFKGRQFDFCDVSATWALRDGAGALHWYTVGANNFANGIRVWRFDAAAQSFGGKTNFVFSDGSTPETGGATGVWGSSPNDVYVIGSLAGTSGGARSGRVYHYDGNLWSRVTEFGEIPPPTGIHGTTHDDVWIALQDGRLLRRSSRVGTNDPPLIVTPPADQTAVVNLTATFAVAAQGTPPLRYQWWFNGVSIAGATNPVLTLPAVQLSNAGPHMVTVSNVFGAVTSAPVNLLVIVPPSFTTQPEGTNVTVNNSITLSVLVSGATEFQWRKNGANIAGATNASYTIPNVQFTDGGSYTVVVANDAGAITSDRAEVIVTPNEPPAAADMFTNRLSLSLLLTGGPPVVVSGFNDKATKEPGEPLHANRIGGRSVWYAWQAPANGIARFNTDGSTFDTVLAVYTGSQLTNLTEVAANDDDDSNAATLATNRFFASEVRFNAVAGTNYLIALDAFGGEGGYFVLLGELEVTPQSLPRITTQPQSQVERLGSNITFSVTAIGTNLGYQWHFNGLNIVGATASSLTRSNIGAAAVGTYSVRVSNTNTGRYADSQRAILEISSDPEQGIVLQDKVDRLVRSDSLPRPPDQARVVTSSQGDFTGFYSVSAGTVGYHLGNNVEGRTDLSEVNHAGLIGNASLYLSFDTTNAGTLVVDTHGSAIDNLFAIYRDNANYDQLASGLLGFATNSVSASNFNSLSVTSGPAGGQFLVAADGVRGRRGTLQINWSFGTAPRSNLSTNAATVQKLSPGDSLTLRVTDPSVTNAAPRPMYRWYRDGQFLAETTDPFLVLSQAGLTNSGTYQVVSENELGIATNFVARLLISQPLALTLGSAKYLDGVFEFALTGTEGDAAVVQATADLNRWQDLSVERLTGYERTFRDVSAGNFAGRYYRVVREGSYAQLAASLTITDADLVPIAGYRFTLPPAIEVPIIVEASSNLQTWTPIRTNPLAAAATLFTDTAATNAPQRYYRLRLIR